MQNYIETHQTSKPFPKHQKRILLDTDGLVKGGGRERGKLQALRENTQIQLYFHCNHLTLEKEPHFREIRVEGLSFLKVQVETDLRYIYVEKFRIEWIRQIEIVNI